ncbi:hypothetical protein WICPIJ_005638 [Wickerhamomyces pijperi]|uniref:Rho1 guanine nucleotide exchange factor TUS1 n=1 Tax=Wickerhamomyces pijperi TaxID=599730 RepID=A0A9P8TLS3_WICPI|nr:hypothetical protein WICPIJ_005638 [Wickerhamomyces pijperi]
MNNSSSSGAPPYPPKNINLDYSSTQDQLDRLAYGTPPSTAATPLRSQYTITVNRDFETSSYTSPSTSSHNGTSFGVQPHPYGTPPKLPPKPEGLSVSTISTLQTPPHLPHRHSTSSMTGPRPFTGSRLTPQVDRRSSLVSSTDIYNYSDFGNSTLNSPEVLYRKGETQTFSPANSPLRSYLPRKTPVNSNLTTPSKAPYPDLNFAELPETPSLDPTDYRSSAMSQYQASGYNPFSSPSVITSSPSAQRRPMGPRPMSSVNSFANVPSPSSSPIKFHNYDNDDRRKSFFSSSDIADFINSDINSVNDFGQSHGSFLGEQDVNLSSPFNPTFGSQIKPAQTLSRKAPYPTHSLFPGSSPLFNESFISSTSSKPSIVPYNAHTASFLDTTTTPYPYPKEPSVVTTTKAVTTAPEQSKKFNLEDLERFSNLILGNDVPTVGKNEPLEKKLPLPPLQTETQNVSFMGRVLPFSADSITARQFSQTKKIQYLSSIFEISLRLEQNWTDGMPLTAKEYRRFLHRLISFHLPKLKSFVVEDQVENIIKTFDSQNCIFIDNDSDTVHFFPNVKPSGILTAITGCYTLCHSYRSGSQYQCHSSRCSLTVYKPPVPQTLQLVKSDEKLPDWVTFWKISSNEIQDIPEDELKKQSHLFDLIRQQQNIIKLGRIQVDVYGPSFTNATPKLVKEVDSFTTDAFESVKPLIDLHQKYLLEPLIEKLNQEGKFISGVGEIFLNWTQKAKNPYLQYTRSQANVREFIKIEKTKKSGFAKWLRTVDQRPEVIEASLDHDRIFSSGFIGHTQQLPLALGAIRKYYREDDMECKLLDQCIEFINSLNRRIDSLQDKSLHRRNTKLLNKTLRWRTTIPIVDLDLLSENRKLIKKSDVQFKEGWSSYVPRTLILLDNYLLITIQDEGFFKIIENPIPVSILQVELKAIDSSSTTEATLFPFKVKHSGLGISFTFYTEDERDRTLWFELFKQAKSSHVSKGDLTEPFKLAILSDQFSSPINRVPTTAQSLLSPQLEEALKSMNPDMKPSARPVMESEILCGFTFQFEGKAFHLIGLNYGLFLTEAHSIDWRRVLQIPRVTQVEAVDNILILISAKGLYYFNLVSILLNYYNVNSEKKVIGDRLSSKDNVILFKTAFHNNTKLLFVLKSNLTGSNKLKIFAPVFDVFNEFQYFQLYKRLNIDSTRITSICTFNEYFVLLTESEFEFYKYDSNFMMQRFRISTDTKDAKVSSRRKEQVENIKKLIKKQIATPVLLRDSHIQRKHIYLIYDEFALVVNSVGNLISDSHVLPFNLKARDVVIFKNFLFCSNEEVVEVFDLRYDHKGFVKYDCVQIIHGNGIKLINEEALIYVMMHPRATDRQLLFSLNYLLEA